MNNENKGEPIRGKKLFLPIHVLKISIEWAISKTKQGNNYFFNPDGFHWVPGVESRWKESLQELNMIMRELRSIPSFQTIYPRNTALGLKDNWKTFFFYSYGLKYEENCKLCPKTIALLQQIPGMKTAFFSILAPGQKIPPHYGPYKGVLRYHLPLIVPGNEKELGIRVGDQIEHWVAGESLIFDDSFEHEAWNLTDQYRVVLFVDFLRPLPLFLDLPNRFMVWLASKSKDVTASKTNLKNWVDQISKTADAGQG